MPRRASAAPPYTGAFVPELLPGAPGHASALASARVPASHAPASIAPPLTVPRGAASAPTAVREESPQFESTKAPAWVVGYLLVCGVLTLLGFVVLYLEHRMLGSASPL